MCKENKSARVPELLKRYGYHSQSYNISGNDKSYFYSSSGSIFKGIKGTSHKAVVTTEKQVPKLLR